MPFPFPGILHSYKLKAEIKLQMVLKINLITASNRCVMKQNSLKNQ